MELNIRHATIADLDAVNAVEAATFPPAEACTCETFRYRLTAYPERFLVAEVDGKVIGIINGCTTNKPLICDELFEAGGHDPKGENQMIFGLGVLPEYQHQGIAGKLIRALVELVRAEGRKTVVLTCKEHLLNYYASFGFENRGVSDSVHGGAVWYDMVLVL